MRFYSSRTFVIFQQVVLMGSGVLVAACAAWFSLTVLTSSARYLLAAIISLFVPVGIATALFGWRYGQAKIRTSRRPVITFENSMVTFRSATHDELTQIPLSSISGVECMVYSTSNSYAARLSLQLWGAPSTEIDITDLSASPQRVFAAFRDHLPNLVQPHADTLRLLAPRYAGSAANIER